MDPQPIYADAGAPALPLHLLDRDGYAAWRAAQPAAVSAWLDAQAFQPVPGAIALLPGETGIAGAVCGIGDRLDPCSYAHAPLALPPGAWTPAGELPGEVLAALQLGWGLGSYRFDRYKAAPRTPAQLRLPHLDAETLDVLQASARVRDWVNTPSQDMGPQHLEAAARELAAAHGAQVEVVAGDALLERNFPAIHAVGRASAVPPRLIEFRWGDPAAMLHVLSRRAKRVLNRSDIVMLMAALGADAHSYHDVAGDILHVDVRDEPVGRRGGVQHTYDVMLGAVAAERRGLLADYLRCAGALIDAWSNNPAEIRTQEAGARRRGERAGSGR